MTKKEFIQQYVLFSQANPESYFYDVLIENAENAADELENKGYTFDE